MLTNLLTYSSPISLTVNMVHMLGFGNCVPKIVSTFQDSRVALLIYEVSALWRALLSLLTVTKRTLVIKALFNYMVSDELELLYIAVLECALYY